MERTYRGWVEGLFALAALFTLAAAASAQTIRGTVVDDVTRTPIPLAHITVLNDSARVLTTRTADTAGTFDVPVPRADSIHLEIRAVGYEMITTSRFSVERGELLEIEARMSAAALPLEPVTVVARTRPPARLERFFQRAEFNRKAGSGRIWMREDLERSGTRDLRSLLAMVPARPAAGCAGHALLLDDLPVEPWELSMIDPQDLEGIEVYRDPTEVPLEYGGLCSVVLLWRKPYEEGGKPLTAARLLLVGAAALLFVILATQ